MARGGGDGCKEYWVLNYGMRQGTLTATRAFGVTCQGFLQLVSVVGALQQASQRNDDVFKAWPFGRILPPTLLKHNHNVRKCV